MLWKKVNLQATAIASQRLRGMATEAFTLDIPSDAQSEKVRAEAVKKHEESFLSDDLKVPYRPDLYMRPFVVSIGISKSCIHAKIIHRTQQRTVASVSTSAKDLRLFLPYQRNIPACKLVGEILATRAKEADCYTVVFTGAQRLEGRVAAIIKSLANCGISVYHQKKGLMLVRAPSRAYTL